MERSEPTFVPEWLKNNSGSLNGVSHQSLLQSTDDQSASVRRKLVISSGDNDSGRPTTSSYFRRSSSSNGSSRVRSYSSFGRRDRDKNKEKFENRYGDFSDPLDNILPSRFEKDGLRRSPRSQLNLSVKRGESWPRKVVGEKNVRNNGKITFERDFPSLGSEEKQVDSEIGRVPSPGLSSAIQSLPVGSSGGDGWTSALAEVPAMVGSNAPTATPASTNVAAGRNMAETLAHGPPRVQNAPQLSVGTQRLEELAVKQSRQLIPMTPSTPKSLALSSLDKPKLKVGQLQHQSSHTMNHSPSTRTVSVNADVTKSSPSSLTIGKLHVLKPSRERNGSAPIAKESLSPTSGGKLPDSSLAERKPSVSATLEKKPSPQAKSRNDFFNLMRKKSMANNSSTPVPAAPPETTVDKPAESGNQGGGVHPLGDNKADLNISNDACIVSEQFPSNVKSQASSDVILYSEEEEARFLRSLGWEEKETTEEEGLTEEEISSFYKDFSKYVSSKTSSFCNGTQLKSLMPLNLLMGKNGDFAADTKVDS